MIVKIISVLISYLIGAIPFSFIIGKANGHDVRKEGSTNSGASNVLRLCGKKAGILAYFCDIGKGMIAVLIPSFILKGENNILIVCAVAAIIGHVFSIFLGFKGGKGVATSAGTMFMLAPISLIITMIFFFIGLFASKKTVAIGSTVGAIMFPIVLSFLYFKVNFLYKIFFNIDYKLLLPITILLALFIIIKHIPNYKRLLKGEENSFSKK
ncbi:glycerol-3-phosphate 1-O-acyltransferase [Brachyspira aalborgi]|uniref:Glycerol-3-phosphate acyltransferase n=1 Tax=Brachyspira aalborgi TaxID=29522 RepID=A0A5C8FY91_9SPIR|nr:glycerol-3-phosphate 1-O-acyltransferase PlsY [Brachyspira aalborgi]TXJ54614.1 glycerol-3-phosphate 1-O-acyltransferase [Brachyspira aalborgi]